MATTIIERPYKYSFSDNAIRYVFSVSNPATIGCAVEVEIYYKGINDPAFIKLHAFTVYTQDGLIYCYVDSYLKSILANTLPDPAGGVVQIASKHSARFYIRFREVTTAAPNPAGLMI